MAKRRFPELTGAPDEAAPEEVGPVETPVELPAAIVAPVAPSAPVVSSLPRVGIDVFMRVSGRKPDQMAGFGRWAKNRKLGTRTIPEWQAALTEYGDRPV